MEAVITCRPHVSAVYPDKMAQLKDKVTEKVQMGQAKFVWWDDIKDHWQPQLKISLIAMIVHEMA